MSSNNLVTSLENIINNIKLEDLPYIKQNTIYIKNYVVSKHEGFFTVTTTEKQFVAKVNFKESAIALARCELLNRHATPRIIELDQEMFKHHNDLEFFKHTIKTSSSSSQRIIRHARIELAESRLGNARKKVKSFIFDN